MSTTLTKRRKQTANGELTPLDQAWREFLPLAEHWLEATREIGQFLKDKRESLGFGAWSVLRRRIADTFRFSLAYQDVAMRVADGELDPAVARLFSPSDLRHLTAEKMPQLGVPYQFVSPETGAPTTKTIEQMTVIERRGFLGPHGPRTLDNTAEKPQTPVYQRAVATSVRTEGGDLIATVNSQKIEVRIPKRMLG